MFKNSYHWRQPVFKIKTCQQQSKKVNTKSQSQIRKFQKVKKLSICTDPAFFFFIVFVSVYLFAFFSTLSFDFFEWLTCFYALFKTCFQVYYHCYFDGFCLTFLFDYFELWSMFDFFTFYFQFLFALSMHFFLLFLTLMKSIFRPYHMKDSFKSFGFLLYHIVSILCGCTFGLHLAAAMVPAHRRAASG